jgi:WD40 repeat protein
MSENTFPGRGNKLVEAARVIGEESKILLERLAALVEENGRLKKIVQDEEDNRTFHKREIERIQACLGELKRGVRGKGSKRAKRVNTEESGLSKQIEGETLSMGTDCAEIEEAREEGPSLRNFSISLISTFTFPSAVSSTAISPDGTSIAAGCEGACYVIKKGSRKTLSLLHFPEESVVEEKAVPDPTLLGEDAHVRDVLFYEDTLVSITFDKKIRIWDLKARKAKSIPTDPDELFQIALRGSILYLCCNNGVFRTFDMEKKVLLERIAPDNKERTYISIAISSSGVVFLGDVDAYIVAYILESGKKAGEWKDHSSGVYCLDINEEKGILVSGSLDNSFIIYGIRTKESSVELTRMHGPFYHKDYVLCAKFIGKSHLVTGSRDNTIQGWSLERGLETGNGLVLNAHEDSVLTLSVHGNNFVSGSGDKNLKIFEVAEE